MAGLVSAPLCAGQRTAATETATFSSSNGPEAESGADAASQPSAPSAILGGAREDQDAAREERVSVAGTPKRMLLDELHIVTSPARVRAHDVVWLLPLAGATAAALATDSRAMRDVVSRTPGLNANSGTASDALRDGFIGVPAVLFAAGSLAHDDKAREAGLLAGEALVDAYAFGAAVKLVTLRERPAVNDADGAFFQTSAGWDSSFPSGHTIVAWSSAAVLAGEYSKPWQQASVYAAATGVSLTRVMAQQHFPSDVVIGSAAGWLIGHYVYRRHHPAARR